MQKQRPHDLCQTVHFFKSGVIKNVLGTSLFVAQIFKAKELIHAYNTNPEDSGFTDDASVMEAAGFKIICFDNPDPNIKITFPEDIERAGKFMP